MQTQNKWWYFIYVILFWFLAVPVLYFLGLSLIFILLPGNLDLAILPIIVGIAFLGQVIYVIGIVLNIFYVYSLKKKYAVELNTQKKLSTTLFLCALLAPLVLLIAFYWRGYNMGVQSEKFNDEQHAVYQKQEQLAEEKRTEELDKIYLDYKKQIEGKHTITAVRKSEIDHGNFVMQVTLDNGHDFWITYWYSDWIAKRFPLAIPDGQKFSKRDDVVGKTFTFTFYDRKTFEDIYYEENLKISQILPPKEARSGDY